MRLGRARLLASAAAITTLAGALAAVAIPSAAAGTTAAPVALTASAAAPIPAGSVRLGALSATTKIHVDVGLNLGDQAGLTALLNGLANPKSPYYRDFLGKGQFGPMFGLSLAQIGQVTATLRSLGLDPGPVDSGRLLIPVTATATQLEHAFGVTLVDYRLPGGRVAYANTAAPKVPAAIAPYVAGVIGLDDLAVVEHMGSPAAAKPAVSADPPATPSVPAAKGPQPCMTATDTAIDDGGYTSNEMAQHYGLNSLYAMGDLGQGVHVAVAELEPNLASDIAAYESCYGITTPVSYINVDGGAGTGAGSGEAALDIENIASLAPDVVIDDYEAPNTTATSLLDVATAVADKKQDQVLSISWGECESEAGASLLEAYGKVWDQLDTYGITVAAAAGDYGSTSCYSPSAATPNDTLAVLAPASTPYGLSVGGTSMTSDAELSAETVWNAAGGSPGAGGGGISAFWCMPQYQDYQQSVKGANAITGLISNYSQKATDCDSSDDPGGYLRQTPDISANAGGTSVYITYYNGAWGGWYGTSAATTLIAADAALIDSSPYCSAKGWGTGSVGLLPQVLYAVMTAESSFVYTHHQGIFQDVTSGNNDYTASGYTGGLYPATAGYDMASGLGVPLMSGLFGLPSFAASLTSEMCHALAPTSLLDVSTKSVSPKYGKAGKATTITVKGTGFLEIPQTDRAEINTRNNLVLVGHVFANCSSHTVCKLTLPALKAGTYDVEMVVATYLACPKTCKVYQTFIFSGPPKITKMSPSSGGKGTKVTIHGTNFYGVSAVYFGGKKATNVKVVSATEITAYVPAGSGSVKVKVVAAGGTSNQLKYTY